MLKRFCRRGHDTYKEGVYFTHERSTSGTKYTAKRCRRCRIEDVQTCLRRKAERRARRMKKAA